MGLSEWLLAGLVVLIFALVILRPDRWNKPSGHSRSDGATAAGADGTGRRDRDNDGDNDGDGDSNGDGGGDGGGGD